METEIVEAKKSDRGFTLVELLIVIVILGILATVTVFAVRGITDKAQTNSCATEKRAIETAFEAFYVDNDQTWPGSLAALTPDYMRTAPDTARWDFTADSTGAGPTIAANATGDCA
jgi:general secretion pathway protein G